ncbi:MAG: PQQ-dependent sugar dehydrogenase [Anaerolineae bacterium]
MGIALNLKRLWTVTLPVLLAMCFVVLVITMLRSGDTSAATTWAPGFYSQRVVGGLTNPTAITWTPDGRMLIALKEGKVLVYKNGQLLSTPFIDLSGEVNDIADRGLLSLAVDPLFESNQYVYLLYTYDPPELPGAPNSSAGADGNGQRVARLVRVKANGDVANLATKEVILGKNSTYANIGAADDPDGGGPYTSCDNGGVPVEDCIPSDSTSHTIGSVVFGTDRSLFVSVGDGARFVVVDPRALRAYDVNSLAGKILRIDPDTGNGYENNPWCDSPANIAKNRCKVYATGLRNPFRMKVDPTTNEPYHGNVGWFSWEEINTGRGKNFGWPCWEGNEHQGLYNGPEESYAKNPATAVQCQAVYSGAIGPIEPPYYAYPHWYNDAQHDASAMAGPVYTGTHLSYPPEYHGRLFIFDYSGDQDWIKYLTLDEAPPQVGTLGEGVSDMVGQYAGPVDLALNPYDGDLYYVVLNGTGPGEVRRIRYTAGNLPPVAHLSATPLYGTLPLTVTLSAAASHDPEAQTLTFAWDLGNGVLMDTNEMAMITHTYTAAGVYTAVMTVTDVLSASDSAVVHVVAGNRPPQANITTPLSGTMYHAGESASFFGGATDPEDSVLGGTQLQWTASLHHEDHVHPDQFRATGTGGSFVYPEHGGGEMYWLELCLTATDKGIPGQGGLGQLQDRRCVALYSQHGHDTQPNKVWFPVIAKQEG